MNEIELYETGQLFERYFQHGNPNDEEIIKGLVLTGEEILSMDYFRDVFTSPIEESDEYKKLEEEYQGLKGEHEELKEKYTALEKKSKELEDENDRLKKSSPHTHSKIEKILLGKRGTIVEEIRTVLRESSSKTPQQSL